MPEYDDIDEQLSDICDETINQASYGEVDIILNSTDNSVSYSIQKLCGLYADEKHTDNLPKAAYVKSCFDISEEMIKNNLSADYSQKPHIKQNNVSRMELIEIIEGYNADTGRYVPEDILSDSGYDEENKKKRHNKLNRGISYSKLSENVKRYILDMLNGFGNLEMKFVNSVLAFCAVVLILSFAAAFSYKPSQNDISNAYVSMAKKDDEYNQIFEKHSELSEEKDRTDNEKEKKEASLKEMNDYIEDGTQLENRISELNDNLYELNSDIEKLESEKKRVNDVLQEYKSAVHTLSPGIYTVGKNILEGEYNITGDDILTVSSSWGKSKINVHLTEEKQKFILENGDTVKIESNTVFDKAD